jgi:glycerol-3-phosphate acyltransferase PlsY
MFPVYLRFRGGKGVATGVGSFLMLAPLAIFLAGIVFILIVQRTRYISLGSIVAAIAIPLLVLLLNIFKPIDSLGPVMGAAIASSALIVFAHRGNIERLKKGIENRFE